MGGTRAGSVTTTGVLHARAGVALNGTLLTEQTLQALAAAQAAPLPFAECGPPNGVAVQVVNGSWACACAPGFAGPACAFASLTLTTCDATGSAGDSEGGAVGEVGEAQ